MEPRFIELSESLNPSHLILKMISGFDLEQLKGLLVKLKKDFLRLSQNQFGVLVVMKQYNLGEEIYGEGQGK